MGGLIKEEIFTTIKKIRFIVLTALLFAGAAAMLIYTKNGYFNDLTCLFALVKYINYGFNPGMGAILLFSVYRKRYTNASITQAEQHGAKRSTAVIARAAAGSIILVCCYAVFALLLVILSAVFGANFTASQTGMLLTELLTGCIAAITLYNGVLFWLYLFAFPAIPMVLYAALFWLPYIIFIESGITDNIYFKVCSFVLPNCGMDVFSASLIYGNPKWIHVLVCIAYIVLTVFLSAVVFRFKKFKEKKKKKGEEAPEVQTATVSPEDPVKETL